MRHRHRYNMRAILTVAAIVLLWRGIWGLSDVYIFPHHPEMSYFLSIFFGVALLFLIKGRRLTGIS
jgi:hypothetical protein